VTNVEIILVREGPMLSGDLAKLVSDENVISLDAAKKQVSRAADPVKRVTGFFINNQSFYFLESHLQDGSYIVGIKLALKTSAKRVFAVLKALENNRGFLAETELPAFMFSPIGNLVGHKRSDIVINEALKLDLIKKEGDFYKLNEVYFRKSQVDFKYYKGVEVAKNFILNQFIDWARMIGLVSFDTPSLYSEFSKFQWAFTAPSYIGTLPHYNNGSLKPAFVLADILIGNEATEDDVLFFVEKIKILKAQRNFSPIIPFLIVDRLSLEALNLLKQNGVVIGFVYKLFGNGYIDLIRSLINTVANAGAILKSNPDEFISLMEKISNLTDGKTNNLRGDIFELAVGYYHARLCNNFDVSKKIYIDSWPYELDVFAVYPDHVNVAECKGLKRPLTLTEVDAWLIKNVKVRSWIELQEAYNNKRHVFELWSTGGFEDDAFAKLQIAGKAKRYDIKFYDQPGIIGKAKEIANSKFLSILNQYFLKEPV
jgi:hypothetical protein